MANIIYGGRNSTLIYVQGLRTETVAGVSSYINNATISFTGYTWGPGATGEAIDGLTAISIAYEAASNGDYSGSTDDDNELTIEKNQKIRGRLTGTLADGTKLEREKIFSVKFPET